MSVALALRAALREIRFAHGYADPHWNAVCDTLVEALVEELGPNDSWVVDA